MAIRRRIDRRGGRHFDANRMVETGGRYGKNPYRR
jgi:hypothetical protein